MKAWRLQAARAKADAVKVGKHEKGRRYGRAIKRVQGMIRMKAYPSQLFINLMAHAGLLEGQPQ